MQMQLSSHPWLFLVERQSWEVAMTMVTLRTAVKEMNTVYSWSEIIAVWQFDLRVLVILTKVVHVNITAGHQEFSSTRILSP